MTRQPSKSIRKDPRAIATALAGTQSARLIALRTRWAHWLDRPGRRPALDDVLGPTTAKVAALRAEAIRDGDEEPFDRDSLAEAFADRLREAGAGAAWTSTHDTRYEAYMDDHPKVEASDEMSWLRRESELASAAGMWWKPGRPEFDNVLQAWELMDPGDVFQWGIDGDLAKALDEASAMAVAELGLRAGTLDPEALMPPEEEHTPSPSP